MAINLMAPKGSAESVRLAQEIEKKLNELRDLMNKQAQLEAQGGKGSKAD